MNFLPPQGSGRTEVRDRPVTGTNRSGATHTVTAFAQSASHTPVAGATVVFDVLTGPNNAGALRCVETGSNSNTTDANGVANCTYVDAGGVGMDTIQASIGALTSNIADELWTK